MRYVNLAWILLLRLMSDQTSNRFSVQSQIPKPRRSHHHLYHPWSIAEDEEDEKRVKTHGNRSGTLNSPSPSSPSSPYMEAESFTQFNAFEAADDKLLVDILKSFNNDERVKNTFGVIITKDEINAFQSIASDWYTRTKTHYTPEYWVPIQWAQRLTIKALQSEYITEPRRAYHLIYQLNKFRDQLQYLQIFSSMMVPLAYAQVVTIAVYTYFTCQLFSSQFVERRNGVLHSGIDLYVPVFDFLSYLFLMGWYKVALCVINPFGDDDEDFQIGDILDYNLETSFRSVYMDPQSFPKTFSAPLYGSEDQVDRSKAQFQKFLDSINPDLWMDLGDPESPKDSRISSHPNSRPSCLSCSGQKLCTTTFSAFRICGR
ncbi:Bestrophin [Fasciola gigantica]|uniref:Bestrophin homolog n=1 Tax=Fasciola gigantica TaxID=46835 RepID=A0A504YSR7_FASGI|nr:Bestrophin [Fasciola gigantica]